MEISSGNGLSSITSQQSGGCIIFCTGILKSCSHILHIAAYYIAYFAYCRQLTTKTSKPAYCCIMIFFQVCRFICIFCILNCIAYCAYCAWKQWPSGHGGHNLLPWGRAAWVRSPPTPTHKTCLLSAVDLK